MRIFILVALLGVGAATSASAREGRVLLVTIDGVRAREVFGGVDPVLAARFGLSPREVVPAERLAPTLARLARSGVAYGGAPGSRFEASGPNFVSLPGYREIMTGRAPQACTTNTCLPLDEPTVLDQLLARHVSAADLAVIASWESYQGAVGQKMDQLVVSAGRHGGVTRAGTRVSDWASRLLAAGEQVDAFPGRFDYRPDRLTAELAVEYWSRVRPRMMVVGLGDTDEYAHRKDYRGYLAALAAADATLSRLLTALDVSGLGNETLVLVTTDHGRSDRLADHGRFDPESRSAWLIAAGPGVAARGVLQQSAPHRLCDLAPTLRVRLGLSPDRSVRAGTPIAELSEGGRAASVAIADGLR